MEEKIVTLTNFIPNIRLEDLKECKISRNLKHLCIYSRSGILSVYVISQNISCIQRRIWQSTDKIKSFAFSDDGSQMLTINECNILELYKLQDSSVEQLRKHNFSHLAEYFGFDKEDFQKCKKASILFFSKLLTIIFIEEKWMLHFKMDCFQPSDVKKIDIPYCLNITCSRDYVFSLTAGGNIYVTSKEGGENVLVLNLYSFLKLEQPDQSHRFCKIAVSLDGCSVAAVDSLNYIYILDIMNLFPSRDKTEFLKESCASTASVTSFASKVSSVTTLSVFQSSFIGDEEVSFKSTISDKYKVPSYKAAWKVYLNSLREKAHHSEDNNGPKLAESSNVQIQSLNAASDSICLNEIHISEMGTGVWYTPTNKCFGGIYSLYDTKTGEIIFDIEVSEDTFVIPGGFSGHVDGFLSPSKLCMYLGTIKRDVFISKIIQCMDAELVGQLFLEEEWQDLVVPLTALIDGLKQRRTDAAHLAFGFHAQAFRNMWLANSDKDFDSWNSRIEKCKITVKNLFSEVEAVVEENNNDVSFLNHLIHLSLNHANDLLHILHDIIYKNYEEHDSKYVHFAKILIEQIMGHIMNLRKHLKQLRNSNYSQAFQNCPLDYLCEDMKLIWKKWELWKDEDVIYDSVMSNNIPLAQTFLINVRGWPVENVSKEIKRITEIWINKLIKNDGIETTIAIFKNLGYKAKDKLREICIKSSDKSIRDNSAEYLFKNNWLQPQEAEAWKFLHTLEAYLEPVEVPSIRKYSQRTPVFKQKRPSLSDIPVTNPELLTIETVLSQPSDWKALVLTELFFNIPGSKISGLITSHDAWKYLLNNNRDDIVICWIDSFYTNGNPSDDAVKCIETWFQKMKDLSFDIVENPQLNTPEEIIQIFLSWHINQELIDYVQEANAMQVTKDLVLDHLTRYGVFTSCDKRSPMSILSRIGRAKLLHKLDDILKKPTSNLNVELFCELLATYCLKNQLYHLPFICFENNSFSENQVQELSESFPEGKRSGTHWFELWFKYKELLANNFKTECVYDAVLSTIKYLSPSDIDLYLSEHSVIVVALIIFSGLSLKHAYEQGHLEGTEINRAIFQSTLHKLPLLEMVLKSSYKTNMCDPDITVYQLLEGCMPFDVSKLFRWQSLHIKTEEMMPHFTHEKLVAKYGYKCSLDYIYYLKQGRPSFAVNTFIVEQFRFFKKLSNKMIKHACNCAHGVALQNFIDTSITSSCISFIGMLGTDTQALRINIHAANIILKYLVNNNQDISVAQHKESVALLLHGLAAGNSEAAMQILNLLEQALFSRALNDYDFMNSSVESLLQWQVSVKFARLHNLQLPQLYLIDCASRDKWLPFILFADIYEYPVEQVLDLTNYFKSSNLQEHLFHSLGQILGFNPDKANVKLLPRDSRKLLYSRIGVGAVDDNQSDSETSIFIQSPEPNINSIISAEVVGSREKRDLFLTLLQCHSSPDPPRAFLDTSVSLGNPVLSVLAACYEPSSLLTCFCNWILASLPPMCVSGISPKILSALHEQVTSAFHVEAVLKLAVSERYTSTLCKGFNIFFPDNPLCTFCEFLEASTNKKDFALGLDKLKQFSTSCLNLKNNPIGAECNYLDGTFFHNSHWISLTSVELIVIALSRCFTSSHYELMFLQVICESNLCEDLPVESPDFRLIGEVIKILSATQTKADLQLLCSKDQQQQELDVCIKGLIEECAFDKAIQLAVIGNLPKDDIIMSQLSHEFIKLTSEYVIEQGNMRELFWDKCHKLFVDENTEPLQVAKFFQIHSDKLTDVKDRYYALYYSLKWFKKARYESDNIPNISDENLVELNMWLSWLQLDINFEKESCQKFSSSLFYTKSDLMKASQISSSDELVSNGMSADQIKLHKLIGSLLDNDDHSTSYKLDQFFKLKNMDLQILLTCMELAEGILTPYQLSAEQRLLITSNAHKTYSSGRYRRRTLKSVRSSAASSVPQSLKSYSMSSEHADTSQNDDHETLNMIEKFSECVKHGKSIAIKIVTCYRISLYLNVPYKDVVSIEDPMAFLKSTISGGNENKFAVISDLLSAAQISREEVAEFLCEEIVAAISKCQISDHTAITFWGYDFDANFHLVLELCSDPSLLASKLLSVARNLGTTQKEAKHQVYYMIVELLIRAHKCYTAACNMEGIATILRKSRLLTSKLLKREEWALMVRLLTGVERYMEMSYIFQILKEHEQFEYLLSKGMDKVWGLKLAVLDFLKTYCPDDKNLFRMVALHFSMYSEVASLWESDAKSLILRVLEMARTEVNSKTSIVFTNNDQTKQMLQTAMDNLTHASQYFIKAKKLNKAMSTAHKAELVALQISLLNFSSSGQTVNCLLELNSQEVANVIIHKLSFPQACIVAQAYGHPTDWGAVLYQHCIVNRETTYLAEFTNSMTLTATLISDVARRFQMDTNITLEMAIEMKKFVACVKSIEVKYRVASQLGFKDIVHGMLNGPDVAYLKDTIWKTGYKRQH